MFDSLALEDPRSTRRRWATFTSFTLETILLGLMIAAPLAFTEKLQLVKLGETIIAPPMGAPPAPRAPEQPTPPNHSVTTEFVGDHLVYGGKVPDRTNRIVDSTTGSSDAAPCLNCVPFGTGDRNTVIQNLIAVGPRPTAAPPANVAPRAKISHIDEGFLIHRVQPIYPKLAQTTGTQGTVVLVAVIDTTGRITQLHAISGHPLLIPAAINAVQQWRYKPYILNGSPVEVETQVSVVFHLNR